MKKIKLISIIVSLCLMYATIGCQQSYEEMHTILINDTIPTNEAESHSAVNSAADIPSETNHITKSITLCESTGYYDGEFLSLYTDYAKSELTTDLMPLDQSDIVISVTFMTDTSGDMVRIIAGFYSGSILLSEKKYNGVLLTDCTTDISVAADVPSECDGIIIAVQAKYETKKGGSRSDIVRFCGLRVTAIENETEIEEIETEPPQINMPIDETADLTEDIIIIIEETQSEVTLCDETNDMTDDTALEETLCEANKNDGTDDVSSDELAVLTNLRTDYGKCHVEMTDYIKVSDQEVTVEMSFYSDSSGDMVRAVVECYDEQYALLESKALTGVRSSAREWVTNVRNVALSDGVAYIKICAEAKYESKKGGSANDTVEIRLQYIVSNS